MPRTIAISMLLALASMSALALAACGEEDAQLLPGATARQITVNLDSVRDLAQAGDCVGAEGAARQVGEQVEAVEVDPELKRALERGAARLADVVARCEEDSEEDIETTTSPEEEEGEEGEERRGGEGGGERRRDRPGSNTRPNRPTTPETPPGGEEGGAPEPPPSEGEGGGEEGSEGPSGGVSPAVPAGEG